MLARKEDLSGSEREFIRRGIECNVRADGRERLETRFFSLVPNAVPHANGSARVRLDGTDVLVTVNAEVGEPEVERPGEGRVVCAAECSPSAGPHLRGYGGQDAAVQLSASLTRFVARSGCVDLAALCIIPGKRCWVLHVDALVLDYAGNVMGAASMAARAAMRAARLPAVEVVPGERPEDREIEVCDDPFETRPVAHTGLPVCVTLTKIGQCFVADPTAEEELCMAAQLTVGVAPDGAVCGVEKAGRGGLSPAGVAEMVKSARAIARRMHEQVDAAAADAADGDGGE